MPHQCTNCGHVFPDGSKEMLSGCPDCGGNKFQFKPSGATTDNSGARADNSADQPQSTAASQPTTQPSTRSPPETEGVTDDAETVTEGPAADAEGESVAQSSARSDVVSPSELTAAGSVSPQSESGDSEPSTPESATPNTDQPAETEAPAEPTADAPTESPVDASAEPPVDASTEPEADQSDSDESNLDQLRKELNNQFESIRIVSPGQYELNLMELYDRDEYIISLREDGRYVIEVPDGWGDS